MCFKELFVRIFVIFVLLCVCISGTIATDSVVIECESEDDASFSLVSMSDDTIVDVHDIVELAIYSNMYSKENLPSKVLDDYEKISTKIEEFNYWQDADIIDIKWLHSFETGLESYVLIDVLGKNGQYGYMVYDCTNEETDSYSASKSPYLLAEDFFATTAEDENIFIPLNDDEIYYFYSVLSYGYGVINENGLVDIYNIRYLLSGEDCNEPSVFCNVSFSQVETYKEDVPQERVLIGDKEAIQEFEARKEAFYTSKSTKTIDYPDSYTISGVPDYQQSTGCTCIPTSMSNIISYWDQNGRPDLVPASSDSDRESYIKENIVSCLTNAGSTEANSSIDPAFAEYIASNGDYKYTGIAAKNPDYDDLISEIYGYEYPCMIGVKKGLAPYNSPHSTTGVGYDCVVGQRVIVHDNWGSTETDVRINWSYIDFMFSCSIKKPW